MSKEPGAMLNLAEMNSASWARETAGREPTIMTVTASARALSASEIVGERRM
jgi:hypothetical protein